MTQKNTNKLNWLRNHTLALIAISTLAGCATLKQPGEISTEELRLSEYATIASIDAVTKLEKNYHSSRKSEIDVFAPTHYSTAGAALAEAKALINEKKGSREQIVHKVAVGEAVLRNADRVIRQIKETLSDEIELKTKLESLNTADVYENEYGSLLDRLNLIIKNIETGKAPTSSNREKLIQDMQQLESKTRRYNAMHEPEEILKRVKYRGGETLAPLTFQETINVFARAEEFIQQNPTYDIGIEQIGKEALFAAKRALHITEQVAALSQKIDLAPEQIILDEEYRLHRVARELSDKDFRDNPLEAQSELLTKAAIAHANELRKREELVLALKETLIEVRDPAAQFSSLNETTNQLKAEKNEWLAKEALYKAKVSELEEKLQQAIAQLDQTQQTVLAIQNQNSPDNPANQSAATNELDKQESVAQKTIELGNSVTPLQQDKSTLTTTATQNQPAKSKLPATIATDKTRLENAANLSTDNDRVDIANETESLQNAPLSTKDDTEKADITGLEKAITQAVKNKNEEALATTKRLIKQLQADSNTATTDNNTSTTKNTETKPSNSQNSIFVDAGE